LDQVSNQINELNEGLKKEVALMSKTYNFYLMQREVTSEGSHTLPVPVLQEN
jgi:hypothetical protein